MTSPLSALLARVLPVKSILALILMTSIVSGCGGGGGGSTPAGPSIEVTSAPVTEGNAGTAEVVFTVTLSEDASSMLTLDYTTADDTATVADSDYAAKSGTLTIATGSRIANVSVFANGDIMFEQNETFKLNLSNPQGIKLSASTYSGDGIINNDENADPKGYFTGTATVNGAAFSDMTALVYSNRILLTSPGANVFYDIVINAPAVNDYTGTVQTYVNGNIQAGAVTISGTTNELSIQGTFAGGTGFATGSFDVAFDAASNKGAAFPRIQGQNITSNIWSGNLYGIDVDTGKLSVDIDGRYNGSDTTDNFCTFPNITPATFVIPDVNANIYQMAHPIENQGAGTCATTYESTGHTGFAAVVDGTGVDSQVAFAFANGTFALFGIMNH